MPMVPKRAGLRPHVALNQKPELCQLASGGARPAVPPHPPKSSKAILSSSTPRSSSMRSAASTIMGGPHI